MEQLGSRFKKLVMRGTDAVLNKNPVEVLVREATGNEHWGPTGTQMQKISQASYNYEDYGFIMTTLWKRLELRGRNWKNVYKALLVIDYLIKNGSDRVIDEFKSRLRVFQGLSHFQYVDEHAKDHGLSVRERSKILIELLQDDRAIREARKIANKNREKYGQSIGSHHTRRNDGYRGNSAYDNGRTGGRDGWGTRGKSPYDDSDTESEDEVSEEDEEDEEPLRDEKPAPVAVAANPATPVNPVTHAGWNAFPDSSTTMADPFGQPPAATTTPAGGFGNFGGPAPAANPTPQPAGFGVFGGPPATPATTTHAADPFGAFTAPAQATPAQNGQFGGMGTLPPSNGAHMNHPAVHGTVTQPPLQATTQAMPVTHAPLQPAQTGNLLTPHVATPPQSQPGGDLLQPVVPEKPKKPADDPWSSLVDLNNITDTNKPGTKKLNFKTEKSSRTIAPVVHQHYGNTGAGFPVYHQ